MKSSITLGIVFLRLMRQAFRAYPVCLGLQGRRSSLHSRDTLDRKPVFQSYVGPENVSAKHSSPNEAPRPICRHQAPFQSYIGPHSSRIMTERDATTASLSKSGSFLFSTGHAVSNLTVSGLHDMLAAEGFDLAPCTAECSWLTSREAEKWSRLGLFCFVISTRVPFTCRLTSFCVEGRWILFADFGTCPGRKLHPWEDPSATLLDKRFWQRL